MLEKEYNPDIKPLGIDLLEIKANENAAEVLLRGGDMSGALLELMEPVIQNGNNRQ